MTGVSIRKQPESVLLIVHIMINIYIFFYGTGVKIIGNLYDCRDMYGRYVTPNR